MYKIYSSKINQQSFTIDKNICCDYCHEKSKRFYVFSYTRMKEFVLKFFCQKCIKQTKKELFFNKEHIEVLVVDKDLLPNDAVLRSFRPTETSDSKRCDSVYRLGEKQIDNEKKIDHTIHCHDPDFMKDDNFIHFNMKSLEVHDKEIKSKDEALGILKSLQKGNKNAIEEHKKKQLEKQNQDQLKYEGENKNDRRNSND